MARVLVIDDDPSLLRALRLGLGASGHEVTLASRGEQGLTQAAVSSPDVIILDLGLPDIDGLTVCTRIRQWSDVPIVVLSATDAEERKVAALDAGADDYVTKPFGMAELAARIRTALRHRRDDPAEQPPTELTAGPLHLDLVHRDASKDGHHVELTNKEFDLIAFLAQHTGKTCTHQMILVAVWGPTYAGESQYLHVYVNRLRHKLGDVHGSFLVTVPGVGYGLNVPAPQ